MQMSVGKIFNIQRFCINDGPGIRTTVFFKGCPLRCRWCHNPESNISASELLFNDRKCIFCRKCADVCENGVHGFLSEHSISREKCISCGKCVIVCPANALEIAGKNKTCDEVIAEVLRDKAFYEDSGGGLTLSGGEPFMQYEFMLEILKKAKESLLHTCIETCGYTDREKILEAAKYTDIFLFDWKITDSVLHNKYTGVGNEKILDNLKALDKNGSKIILRCPIIPAVNDTEEHFKGIAQLANSLQNVIGIEISPYHELGLSKLSRMGREAENQFAVPKKEDTQSYIEAVKKYTYKSVKKM